MVGREISWCGKYKPVRLRVRVAAGAFTTRINVGAGKRVTSDSWPGVYYYWLVLICYLSGVYCAARLTPLPFEAT